MQGPWRHSQVLVLCSCLSVGTGMALTPVREGMEELWVRQFNLWVHSSGDLTSPRVLGSCDLAVMSLLPSARSGGMGSSYWRQWGPAGPCRGKLNFLLIELSVVTQACP